MFLKPFVQLLYYIAMEMPRTVFDQPFDYTNEKNIMP